MNPRQRRGVILIAFAIVGAFGVFFLILSYVGEVQSRVGPVTTALQLTADVQPHARVTPNLVEVVEVPERWLPETVLRAPEEIGDRVAVSVLQKGAYLQEGMLDEPPVLEAGQRELAITIDAETGVAGKIRPGDLVDIYATFEGDPDRGTRSVSRLLVANIRVVEVGQLAETEDTRLGETNLVVPITFALSNEEALILSYAESFATKVRLSLLKPGEQSNVPPAERVFPPRPGAG